MKKIRTIYMALWRDQRKARHCNSKEVIAHPERFDYLHQLWKVTCSGAALARALIRHGNDKAQLVYQNANRSR